MAPVPTRLCSNCGRSGAEPVCPTCGIPTIHANISGRYQLRSVLGRGGMATVFRAVQLTTEREVAVKVIEVGDPRKVAWFGRESRLTAKLEHPNIIRVYDSGVTEEGRPYLVMELLRGRDLHTLLEQGGPLPLERAVGICLSVLKALHVAHGQGMVHRDIKPANIFLHNSPDGEEIVRVMDFGVAGLVEPNPGEPSLTQTGQLMGTPAYMSPEQIRGDKADARADLYAVGLVFHEMLTGIPAFNAETPMKVALKVLQEAPAPIAQLRPELAARRDVAAVLQKLTAKEAAERPASAQAAMQQLLSLAPSLATPSMPPPAAPATPPATPAAGSPPAPPAGKKSVVGLAIAALGVLVLAGTGAAVYLRGQASPATVADGGTDLTTAALQDAGAPLALVAPFSDGGLDAGALAGDAAVLQPEAGVVSADASVDVVDAGAPEGVRLLVASAPPGASVFIDGEKVGVTKLEHRVARSDKPLEVRIEKEGHQPAVMQVTPSQDRSVNVLLQMMLPVKAK